MACITANAHFDHPGQVRVFVPEDGRVPGNIDREALPVVAFDRPELPKHLSAAFIDGLTLFCSGLPFFAFVLSDAILSHS